MTDITSISHILIGITGLLVCFFGYKIIKVVITTAGFVLGAAAAGSLAHNFFPGNLLVIILSAFIGGLLCSVLAVGFLNIGLFALGGFVGVATAMMFTSEILFLAIFGIAAGVLTFILKKFMLVIATALAGAWTAVFSFYMLSNKLELDGRFLYPDEIYACYANNQIMLIATGFVALLGLLYQFHRQRKDDK